MTQTHQTTRGTERRHSATVLDNGMVGLLGFDESPWEAANAWVAEPADARTRLSALRRSLNE